MTNVSIQDFDATEFIGKILVLESFVNCQSES